MKEIPGSEFELDCDLVLLALGFLGPESETDRRAARRASSTSAATSRPDRDYKTSVPGRVRLRRRAPRPVAGGVGDLGGPRGARGVDAYLMGETFLPASPDL